jgi:hypothetical protein
LSTFKVKKIFLVRTKGGAIDSALEEFVVHTLTSALQKAVEGAGYDFRPVGHEVTLVVPRQKKPKQ